MRLRRYLILVTIAVTACIAGARSAHAQSIRGIKLGETFVLHLGIGLEFDWDSNVFYQPSGSEQSAFSMRLTPGFNLTTRPRLNRRMVEFELHGGLNYVEYLTSDKQIEDHRQFNVDAGLLASFFTMNPYNFVIFDNYVRSTQPPYTATSENLNRDTNQLGLRVNLSPGGGRLTFIVGYVFGIDYFEPLQLQPYDLQSHSFDFRASWRFLPKTAVYIAANETINHYPTPPAPGTTTHPDSTPFHVDAGLQGLITVKLTVNAWIGYGNGFYASGPSPNTAIGGLSLTWKPTVLSTGTVGYQHDFQNSLLGSYYDEDAAYVSWTQLIWRFTGFVRVQYSNLRYKGVQMFQATTDGTDNVVQLNTRVDYPFKDWLFASVGYDLQLDRSNRTLVGGGATTPLTVPTDYNKNVVYLRLTATY